MADLHAVRAALQTQLQTIAGLNAYAEWPDSIVPPAALIKVAGGDYQSGFGSTNQTDLKVEVHLVVGVKGGLVNAEKVIEPYISNTGSQSVRAAIAADHYLGNTVQFARVTGWRDYDTVEVDRKEWLGVIFDLEVMVA